MVLISATGISAVVQAVTLLRQIFLVTFFGLSRSLDLYSTVYSILAMTLVLLASIVENIFLSLLGGDNEVAEGGENLRTSAEKCFLASLVTSVLAVLILGLVFPIVSIPFTAGFSDPERSELMSLAWFALPWALSVIPYAALSACVKSKSDFGYAFFADLVVASSSTVFIFVNHEVIGDAVLGVGLGYVAGIGLLLWRLKNTGRLFSGPGFPWRIYLRRIFKHFGSSQTGTLVAVAERYWLSYLPAGGIGVLALVQQLTMGLSGLLTFKDAYLVPLLDPTNRASKLGRLQMGLFMVGFGAAAGVISLKLPICQILFEHGKIALGDIDLIALLLTISLVGMVVSIIATPIWRLQQLLGVYRPITLVYFVLAILMVPSGYATVVLFDLGTVGMSLSLLINACVACVWAQFYAKRFDVKFNRSDMVVVLYFCFAVIVSGYIARSMTYLFSKSLILELVICGVVYLIGLLIFMAPFRQRLQSFLLGKN